MNFLSVVMLGIIYFMLFNTLLFLNLFYSKRKHLMLDPKPTKHPLVSIIIPAWNEGESIKNSIISSLALEYPKKEIIVVNDGSTDNTREVCEEFEKKGLIQLINKKNGGKASAMNAGLKVAKGEYVCCMDADSFFTRSTLKNMVGYMEDSEVGAVTTSMKVYKPKGLLQKIQWMEYIFAIYLRKLQTYIDALYVVPGPGGLYRTSLLKKLGGFDENSITEDMEIAFRIQQAGYKIKNSLNAIVNTVAPNKLVPLVKQRIRWYAGFFDNVTKYRTMMLNPKYGSLGMFMIPTATLGVGVLLFSMLRALYLILDGAILPIKSLFLVGFDWNLFIQGIKDLMVFNPDYMTFFGIVLAIIGFLVIYLSLKTSGENVEFKSRYSHYAVYLIGYSFLMTLFWVCSIVFIVLRGKNKGWKGDKI